MDAQSLGPQTVYRLRGLAGVVNGAEIDLLHPFEPVEPVVQDLHPNRAGLTREQYAHILATFRPSTYPKAPDLCLQRSDELGRGPQTDRANERMPRMRGRPPHWLASKVMRVMA